MQRSRGEFRFETSPVWGNDEASCATPRRANERGKAQALDDLLVFSTTATSSFMAGFLQDRWGWQPLNWFSVLLMLAAAAAVIWLRAQRTSLSPAH